MYTAQEAEMGIYSEKTPGNIHEYNLGDIFVSTGSTFKLFEVAAWSIWKSLL